MAQPGSSSSWTGTPASPASPAQLTQTSKPHTDEDKRLSVEASEFGGGGLCFLFPSNSCLIPTPSTCNREQLCQYCAKTNSILYATNPTTSKIQGERSHCSKIFNTNESSQHKIQ